MIPLAFINEWRTNAPWITDAQVEQDLVLSRALVEIYSDPFLKESLAFRGGTALHKLYIHPPARYSEDIDLVQIKEGPIGATIEALRNKLDPWLNEPKRKFNQGRATLVYRFNSESLPVIPMRLKVEINTREHFSVLGLLELPFEINSRWFSNQTIITTYKVEELLGTKLRALYQRKKGRDLFDLITSLKNFPNLDIESLIKCFNNYMSFNSLKISHAEFEANIFEKLNDTSFIEDIFSLLPNALKLEYDPVVEMGKVHEKIISKLEGAPWSGLK